MDEAPDSGPGGGLEDGPGALDVDAAELALRGLVAVDRGEVHDRLTALHRPLEPGGVEQVDACLSHLGAAAAQCLDDVPADEARGTGDVDQHKRDGAWLGRRPCLAPLRIVGQKVVPGTRLRREPGTNRPKAGGDARR